MVEESNQNVFLIQIDVLNFTEFEISKFEISRFDCIGFGEEITQVVLIKLILCILNGAV